MIQTSNKPKRLRGVVWALAGPRLMRQAKEVGMTTLTTEDLKKAVCKNDLPAIRRIVDSLRALDYAQQRDLFKATAGVTAEQFEELMQELDALR